MSEALTGTNGGASPRKRDATSELSREQVEQVENTMELTRYCLWNTAAKTLLTPDEDPFGVYVKYADVEDLRAQLEEQTKRADAAVKQLQDVVEQNADLTAKLEAMTAERNEQGELKAKLYQVNQELERRLTASEAECVSWRTVLNNEREAAQKKLEAMTQLKELQIQRNAELMWERDALVKQVERDVEHYSAARSMGEKYRKNWVESEQQLAASEREIKQWRIGGVTEELLRKQDGHLKLGKGCVIVIESEWDQLQATVTALRNEHAKCNNKI